MDPRVKPEDDGLKVMNSFWRLPQWCLVCNDVSLF